MTPRGKPTPRCPLASVQLHLPLCDAHMTYANTTEPFHRLSATLSAPSNRALTPLVPMYIWHLALSLFFYIIHLDFLFDPEMPLALDFFMRRIIQ